MEKVIYFDYCAFGMIIVLIGSSFIRQLTKGRINRYFIGLCFVVLITTMADIMAIGLDNNGPGFQTEKIIAHTAYLLLHSLSTPIYINFAIAIVDGAHMLKRYKVLPLALMLPILLVIVLLAINFSNGCVFYLDENDAYTRGEMFNALYVCSLIYSVVGFIFIIHSRKLYKREKFIALFSLFPFMLAAVLYQFLVPTMPMEMLASAFSLMLISTIIQKPEELIDSDTKLMKKDTYYEDMRVAFKTHKKVDVILMNLINYDSLYEMLGMEESRNALEVISQKIQSINSDGRYGAELYHLDHGMFRMVINKELKKDIDTKKFASSILREFADGLELMSYEINLVFAMCIVNCPKDVDSIEGIVTISNELNKTNQSGVIYKAEEILNNENFEINRHIDSIIENALANHKFEVYYQPIYSVKDGKFKSAEALLRLKDDKYGFVSPMIFIPAAERNGSIHRIGSFVLDSVCNFIGSEDFTNSGLEYIEVNLSVAQCIRPDLADEVVSIMRRYDISPDTINLEITETATSYSQSILEDNLNKLSEYGINFSLDDFGTGYSNMQRIASLPLELVKLDKIFTDFGDNDNLKIILDNMIDMVKALDKKILIEGVETEDMANEFIKLGCDYIQGYYYARPVCKNEFVEFLANNN